jgi:hypothetical protein
MQTELQGLCISIPTEGPSAMSMTDKRRFCVSLPQSQYQNRVILKDNEQNRIAKVLMNNGELQCLLDERSDCVHVGFVYSLPEHAIIIFYCWFMMMIIII